MSDITNYENLANAIILQAEESQGESEEQDGDGGQGRDREILPFRVVLGINEC